MINVDQLLYPVSSLFSSGQIGPTFIASGHIIDRKEKSPSIGLLSLPILRLNYTRALIVSINIRQREIK